MVKFIAMYNWKINDWARLVHGFIFLTIVSFSGLAQEGFTGSGSAREYADFGFIRDFSVTVTDSAGNPFQQPWVGGLNACQLSQVDIDIDGVMDLVVFDRHGNRLLPFIYQEPPGAYAYVYAPEYQFRFPPVKEWMNLVDYNCDGKNDLFTYTTGGIRIYRNVSDTVLKFTLEKPQLLSYYYNGYVNLFALTDDYPAFTDVDGDGDMDILNFFTLGKYLSYHKNLSVEKYGVCDSLDFRLTELCWGYFEENELSNVLVLDIECEFHQDRRDSSDRRDRHAGSSLLALDLDADEDKDLIIGDVDYATLIGLVNGGTRDSAHMISQDTAFPGYDRPVGLMSMPVCGYLDLDHDGSNELVVSPFDPAPDRSENLSSLWLYENLGTTDAPVFSFEKGNYLQDMMIDVGGGAYPVIADIDQDGLEDLVVGNYGYLDSTYYSFGYLYLIYRSQIAFFKNKGTQNNPQFRLVDRDLAGLSGLEITGAYPAFADLDGDEDMDMVVGNSEGTLIYCENLASPGNNPLFEAPVLDFQGIDVGGFSTPQLIDMDRDSRIDLVIGKIDGTLSFYRNTGSASDPVFTLVSDHFGGVDVTNINLSLDGFSTPCFFEVDGEYRLFAGSEFGQIFYFRDIDDNLNGDFTRVSDNLLYIHEGSRIGMAVWNFNGDAYSDLLIGNYSGGVSLFKGSPPSELSVPYLVNDETSVKIYPNPAHDIIYIKLCRDGSFKDADMQILDVTGRPLGQRIPLSEGINAFSTGNLSKGVYVLHVRLPGHRMEACKLLVY
jgi:hypothetical protein